MSLKWKYKRLWWKCHKFLEIHTPLKMKIVKYNGTRIKTKEQTNDKMIELVNSDKPFCVARIGGSELRAIVSCQAECKNPAEKRHNYSLLNSLSGFFDPEDALGDFSRLMENNMSDVDMMCVWFNKMEDVIIDKYCKKDVTLGILEGLEPWYNLNNPWTKFLKGKKVLVVHPFKDSILSQYEKREKLFPGTEILPEFELTCIKAVQTLMGERDSRINTWFEALEFMTDEALKQDFDIALIACGAYGLPLAVNLKRAGKQAIHMGGALQLLFGIRGKRWDNFDKLMPFYSDEWTYPLSSEKLSKDNTEKVEHGCYW